MSRPNQKYNRPRVTDEFDSKVLDLARVSRMTGGGKRFRFRAAVAVGDKRGRIGFAVAKGVDTTQSVEKATRLAKKRLLFVPTVNQTIAHEVYAKFGAAEILLKPQSKGRGLVAGGVTRLICQLVGLSDISAKVLGSTRNKINNARATFKALSLLKTKPKTVKVKAAKTEPADSVN